MIKKISIGLAAVLLAACDSGSESIRAPDLDSTFTCGDYLQGQVMDPGGALQAVNATLNVIANALDDDREIHSWFKNRGTGVGRNGNVRGKIISGVDEYCRDAPRHGINDAIIASAEIVYRERADDPMFHSCNRLNSGYFNEQDLLRAAELTEIPEEMVGAAELLTTNIKAQCQERPNFALKDQVERLQLSYNKEVRSLEFQARNAETRRVYDDLVARFEDVKDRASSMLLSNGDLRCDVYSEALKMFDEIPSAWISQNLDKRDMDQELRYVVGNAVEAHRQQTNSDVVVMYAGDYSATLQSGFPAAVYCQNNNLNAYYEAIRAEVQAQQDAEQARYEAAMARNQAMEEKRKLNMQLAVEAERERRAEYERQQAEIDRQQEEEHMRLYGRPMRED